MEKIWQIEKLVGTLKNLINVVKNNPSQIDVLKVITDATCEINEYLYQTEYLKFQKYSSLEDISEIEPVIAEIETLFATWENTLSNRRTNKIDSDFIGMYERFKFVDEEVICRNVIDKFLELPKETQVLYARIKMAYPFLKNTIDSEKGDFSLIKECVELVYNNIEDIKWFYEKLGDYRSKAILNGVLGFWFDFDLDKLNNLKETVFAEYFDLDTLEMDKDAVVVDLGAYIGDSAVAYADTYNNYAKIYAYEITPSTFEKLRENVSEYPNIIPVNKGVSSVHGQMYVSSGEIGLGNMLQEHGEIPVEVVTLDEDIQEVIHVIKMDIEGAEKDAILGAKRHIKEEKPKLFISLYHKQEDIIEIPKLIHSIRDDYKFFLRYNGSKYLWSCDYNLIAG